MSERKYTKDHEWVEVDGDIGTVGISDHAQEQLGDIVFIELPKEGREVNMGDEIATIESVKAASEIYAPVSGTVVEVNSTLDDEPALVNSDAFGEGWFFRIQLSDASELNGLMDEEAYKAFVEEEG